MKLSPNLEYFKEITECENGFQVVVEMDYVNLDCFAVEKPVIVPARTFLSQLSV